MCCVDYWHLSDSKAGWLVETGRTRVRSVYRHCSHNAALGKTTQFNFLRDVVQWWVSSANDHQWEWFLEHAHANSNGITALLSTGDHRCRKSAICRWIQHIGRAITSERQCNSIHQCLPTAACSVSVVIDSRTFTYSLRILSCVDISSSEEQMVHQR